MRQKQYRQKQIACQGTKKYERRHLPLRLGIGVVAAGAAIGLATLAYAYLATHPPRKRLWSTPDDLGLPYETVRFPSHSGLTVFGWFIPVQEPAQTRAVIVLCHGYPMNRSEMLPYAEILHEAGFAVLLFDFRAMGESEGDLSSIGHFEVEDLRGALDYLNARPDTSALQVGAMGLSLGAAVALMTAAVDVRIRAVVAEGSYASLDKALSARFRVVMGPLGPHIARPVLWWARRWVDVAARDVSPLISIGLIGPRAVLLIQGKRDLLVPWEDSVKMYNAASEPRRLWLLERSGHATCLRDQPGEYRRQMTEFFTEHLCKQV